MFTAWMTIVWSLHDNKKIKINTNDVLYWHIYTRLWLTIIILLWNGTNKQTNKNREIKMTVIVHKPGISATIQSQCHTANSFCLFFPFCLQLFLHDQVYYIDIYPIESYTCTSSTVTDGKNNRKFISMQHLDLRVYNGCRKKKEINAKLMKSVIRWSVVNSINCCSHPIGWNIWNRGGAHGQQDQPITNHPSDDGTLFTPR